MDGKEIKALSHHKTLLVLSMLALWVIALHSVFSFRPEQAQAQVSAAQTFKDYEELARLYREDQADRTPKDVDWARFLVVRDADLVDALNRAGRSSSFLGLILSLEIFHRVIFERNAGIAALL
jgi:hypothetical protein